MAKTKETPKFDYVNSYTVGGESSMELFHGLDGEGFVADNFVSEFKWLEQYSSSITININSTGGSVVSGLNIFSTILNSKIPTKSVVVGMASVIALAADETVMNDYSLMMIHMPYSPSGEGSSEQLDHFASMLTTIYEQRLGKTKEEVTALLEGVEGEDGSWFSAEEALKLGFISGIAETLTQKSLKKDAEEFISNKIEASEVANRLHEIAASITTPEIKNDNKENIPVEGTAGVVVNKSVPENKPKQKKMDLKKISAVLGIENATESAIQAKVDSIIASNANLEKEISTANKDLLAKGEALSSASIELETVKAKLETTENAVVETEAKVGGLQATIAAFEAEKEEAQKKTIESIVDSAVEGGKISSDAKATWIGLMEANFEGANAALETLNVSNGGKVKLTNVVKETVAEVKSEKEVEKPAFIMSIQDKMKEIRSNNK